MELLTFKPSALLTIASITEKNIFFSGNWSRPSGNMVWNEFKME